MCDTSIHSGHFMVSSLSEDNEVELPVGLKGYNFETANHQLSNTYSFGGHDNDELPIDASLRKLFDCMTLAYRAKLVSPKWKHFRGIDVKLKDKIRLNNLIWREWHMQFRQKKNSIICQFEIPVGDMTHSKPEAVVLEGKYWKRRFYFCTTEYRKWRQFYKDHFIQPRNSLQANEQVAPPAALTPLEFPHVASSNGMELADISRQISNNELMADLPNLLFSSVLPAFAFPDPKEISTWGLPDIVQPGLLQLQPSYDDFLMDTIEPLSMATDIKPTIDSISQQTLEHDFLRPFIVSGNHSNIQKFSGNKRSSATHQPPRSSGMRTGIADLQDCYDDSDALWSPQNSLPIDSKQSLQNFSIAQISPSAMSSGQMSESAALTSEHSSPRSSASVEKVRPRGPALKHSAVLGPVWPGMISRMKMGQCIAASVVNKSQSDGRVTTLKNSSDSVHRKMTPPKGSQPAVLKALLLDKHDTLPQRSPPDGVLQKVQRSTVAGSALPKTLSGSHLAMQQKTALRVRRCSLESVSTAFSSKITDTGQCMGPLASNDGFSQQSPRQPPPQQQQQQPQQQQRGRQRQVSFTDEVTTLDSDGGVYSIGTNSEEKPGIGGNQKTRVMTAEYRRRCMIKHSFEALNHLVPSLHSADSGKINKAVILMKAAEYCQRLKDEKELMLCEITELQKEISTLQNDISCFQLQLPATGASPVTHSSLPHHMVQLYDNYVQSQTLINWKFWIFSMIIQQLFETYVSSVSSVKTNDEFDRCILSWIQYHCSLVSLRPVVLVSLRKLCTSTSILTDPTLVPRQAQEAATRHDN